MLTDKSLQKNMTKNSLTQSLQKLMILIPAYNEQEVLPESLPILQKIIQQLIDRRLIASDSGLMIVSDGSTDQTWSLIEQAHEADARVMGVKFSRNFGHQNALIAGLTVMSKQQLADFVISIDADLQDDPQAIFQMVEQYQAGSEVVFGVRNNRDSDSWLKRVSAEAFYSLLGRLGVHLVPEHADFRLLGPKAITAFLQYQEENMFIRGIIPLLGFNSSRVYYARHKRLAGKSKYPLFKMLSFAWDGVTSFSIAPLRLVLSLGVGFALFGFVMLIYTLVTKLRGVTAAGWSSLMISIWIVGGCQMMAIGLTGEYIGKIFSEVKHRPRYTIEKKLLK